MSGACITFPSGACGTSTSGICGASPSGACGISLPNAGGSASMAVAPAIPIVKDALNELIWDSGYHASYNPQFSMLRH